MRIICKRVGARWLKAGLVFVVTTWRTFVAQRHTDRGIVKRWLATILNREIAAAMLTWKRFVAFSKTQEHLSELETLKKRFAEREAEAQRLRLERVVLRFRHQHISSAFQGWKEFIHLRKRYRRFAAKIFRHSLVGAFDQWFENAAESKRLRLVCQRVLQRMLQRKLASCFHAWNDNAREQIRMRGIGQRIVKRLLMRKVSACFISWLYTVNETKRLRTVGLRVVQRMLRRQLSATFSRWNEASKEQVRTLLELVVEATVTNKLTRAISSLACWLRPRPAFWPAC